MDIQHLLAQPALAAARVLELGQIRRALEQLGQRLHGGDLVVVVGVHAVAALRVRVLAALLLRRLLHPAGHRVQLRELPAQPADVFLAADDVLGLGDAQLAQPLVAGQRDGHALVVAVVPQRRWAVIVALGLGRCR